jgi:hypothetical protein
MKFHEKVVIAFYILSWKTENEHTFHCISFHWRRRPYISFHFISFHFISVVKWLLMSINEIVAWLGRQEERSVYWGQQTGVIEVKTVVKIHSTLPATWDMLVTASRKTTHRRNDGRWHWVSNQEWSMMMSSASVTRRQLGCHWRRRCSEWRRTWRECYERQLYCHSQGTETTIESSSPPTEDGISILGSVSSKMILIPRYWSQKETDPKILIPSSVCPTQWCSTCWRCQHFRLRKWSWMRPQLCSTMWWPTLWSWTCSRCTRICIGVTPSASSNESEQSSDICPWWWWLPSVPWTLSLSV